MDEYKAHWVSMIIQEKETSVPYLCALYDSCGSLEVAKSIITRSRCIHRVLSAWVDTFVLDEDNNEIKVTLFHECYIDAFGKVTSND